MSHEVAEALPWPLFTIDFEASSLMPGSYPIELGVARWRAPGAPIEGWSSLIRPVPSWVETGSWAEEAQAVHGIRPDELEAGRSPGEVLSTLNRIVGPHAAFCDGGTWDFGWARRLVLAAGFRNTFRLGDFDMLASRCDPDGRTRMAHWLERIDAPHRARGDAERLLQALAHGLGLRPDVEPLPSDAEAAATATGPHLSGRSA